MISNQKFQKLKEQVLQDIGKQSVLETQLQNNTRKLSQFETRKSNIEKSREVIQLVAVQTQSNLEFHISSTVTLALKSVDANYPEFVTRFITRRNQPECDLLFKENDREVDPMNFSGGGAKAICSFALQIVVGLLMKVRPTFLLDEPFASLSPDKHEKASEMVKMICDELGIQIIMVSHSEDINIKADKTYLIEKVNGISKIKEVNNFI